MCEGQSLFSEPCLQSLKLLILGIDFVVAWIGDRLCLWSTCRLTKNVSKGIGCVSL